MRTWKSLVIACCFAGALGYCCSRGSCCRTPGGDPGPTGTGGGSDASCQKKHGFGVTAPRAAALLAEAPTSPSNDLDPPDGGTPDPTECPQSGCGHNTFWLGSGVQFRTLHLSPHRRNQAGLSIVGFVDADQHPLRVDVQRDVVSGTYIDKPGGLSGHELVGTTLLLGHLEYRSVECGAFPCRNGGRCIDIPGDGCDPDRGDRDCPGTCDVHPEPRIAKLPVPPPVATPVVEYKLRIVKVDDERFWAQRKGHDESFLKYSFVATASDGCQVEVCAPGLDDHHPTSISGTAAIFRGDYYSETTHEVWKDPHELGDDDAFNIACLGTAQAKLHYLRHTSASQPVDADDKAAPVQVPTENERRAMLQLLTADYCGDGSWFTQHGVSLRFQFNNPSYHLTADSQYNAKEVDSIDGLWSPGGPLCIGTPRLMHTEKYQGTDPASLIAKIKQICIDRHHKAFPNDPPAPPLIDCAQLGASYQDPFATGDYAIAGNPKPVTAGTL